MSNEVVLSFFRWHSPKIMSPFAIKRTTTINPVNRMLEDRSWLKPFHSFALWKCVIYFDALDTNAMTGSKKHTANYWWSDDQFNHRFTVHLHQFVSSLLIQRLQGHEVELFSLSHGLGERCPAVDVKKATLALERNESSGANPCPTCAQMYGWWKSYYLLILPLLESPVQICCLVAVSLLSHVFRSSQHRTMLDYVVYIETLSSCQCNQGPNLGPFATRCSISVPPQRWRLSGVRTAYWTDTDKRWCHW